MRERYTAVRRASKDVMLHGARTVYCSTASVQRCHAPWCANGILQYGERPKMPCSMVRERYTAVRRGSKDAMLHDARTVYCSTESVQRCHAPWCANGILQYGERPKMPCSMMRERYTAVWRACKDAMLHDARTVYCSTESVQSAMLHGARTVYCSTERVQRCHAPWCANGILQYGERPKMQCSMMRERYTAVRRASKDAMLHGARTVYCSTESVQRCHAPWCANGILQYGERPKMSCSMVRERYTAVRRASKDA
ncbi:hypothetical protein RRG08_022435 [Elysia crispata]|uniref:Uncharacterized protein n=1 Tax=Elysia crispata TaxID=231223 RepID=A0AAE0Z167_9GAST|nr:hypothetical protein RRG08_022435 [Elysia crispata]